jgi:hypothetical protein
MVMRMRARMVQRAMIRSLRRMVQREEKQKEEKQKEEKLKEEKRRLAMVHQMEHRVDYRQRGKLVARWASVRA